MKKLILFLAAAASLLAQNRTTVAISRGTPDTAVTSLYFYDGSNNLTYVCRTPPFMSSFANPYYWAVTPSTGQGTLTSIVVSSNVGTVTVSSNHGLAINNLVTVSGSTTSALNGTYVIQTVGSTTTFTITTSGVSDGTYNTSALKISTTAPRTSDARWNIEHFTYDMSNNLIADQSSMSTASGSMATTNYDRVCDNRAVTTGTTKQPYQ